MIGLSAVVTSILVALLHWRLNPFAGAGPLHWTGAVAAFAQVGLLLDAFTRWSSARSPTPSAGTSSGRPTGRPRLTNDPDAYRRAFELLTRMNLADPDPPRWEEIMFDDHPPMNKRIAMADRYVKRSA